PGADPWTPLPDVGWAVGARLVGYGLPAEAQAGQIVGVTLRWRVAAPAPDEPGQDYTFAVGLVDAAGQAVAGRGRPGHPPAARPPGALPDARSALAARGRPEGARPGPCALRQAFAVNSVQLAGPPPGAGRAAAPATVETKGENACRWMTTFARR